MPNENDALFNKPPPAPEPPAPRKRRKPSSDPLGQAIQTMVESALAEVLPEDKVREIVAEIVAERLPRRVIIERPDVPDKDIGDAKRHELFEPILRCFATPSTPATDEAPKGYTLPTYLYGESGAGKTHLAGQIADAIGLPLVVVSCSIGTSEGRLYGKYSPSGAFIPLAIGRAYAEPCVILIDELDRLEPGVACSLHCVLESPWSAELPNGDRITRHPDCHIIATGNTPLTGASRVYSAAEQQDAALANRFGASWFDFQPDRALETALCEALGPQALTIQAWAAGVRSQAESANLRNIVSMRWVLQSSRAVTAGAYGVDDAKRMLRKQFSDDAQRKIPALAC